MSRFSKVSSIFGRDAFATMRYVTSVSYTHLFLYIYLINTKSLTEHSQDPSYKNTDQDSALKAFDIKNDCDAQTDQDKHRTASLCMPIAGKITIGNQCRTIGYY